MDEYASLSHSKWECKYHVVFIPKCRRKTLYGELRKHLGEVFRKLAQQKESRIEEGHLMPDHDFDSAEIRGLTGGRFYQGQECHPFGPCVWREEAQLCRAALLGKRLFRLDRRSRRSRDTGVHQEPGARGRPLGPNEFVALIGHLRVANECRAASATLTAASSGPIPKAPGSAGGYLLPGITNRYCSPSFETATEPVIGRAFARPVGDPLRMRSNSLKHNNLMLRSERRERLEAWAVSDSQI